MVDKPIHILAINETKLDDSILDQQISISGYNMIRKYRNRKGGGVLMYIHESIIFSERHDLCPNSMEIICAEIKKQHNKTFLGAAPFTVLKRLEQCSGIICNGVHTPFWNSV